MRIEIKNLIDELISFSKQRTPTKHLKKLFDEKGETVLYSTIKFLLGWIKGAALGYKDRKKYDFPDDYHERLATFLEKCPELGEIFLLHEKYLGWAAELSENERDEIIDYIHKNHTITLRIRTDERREEK